MELTKKHDFPVKTKEIADKIMGYGDQDYEVTDQDV